MKHGRARVFRALASFAVLAGHKQPQQLAMLNYLLTLGAEFDIILNVEGFNEFAMHWQSDKPEGFPAYPRTSGGFSRTLRDIRSIREVGKLAYLSDLRGPFSRLSRNSPVRTLRLVAKLGDVLLRKWEDRQTRKIARLETLPSFAATGPTVTYPSKEAIYDDLLRF